MDVCMLTMVFEGIRTCNKKWISGRDVRENPASGVESSWCRSQATLHGTGCSRWLAIRTHCRGANSTSTTVW